MSVAILVEQMLYSGLLWVVGRSCGLPNILWTDLQRSGNSAAEPPPDTAQRHLPPDPSDEQLCDREELANNGDVFATDFNIDAAWEAGV